jgi:hypothetical protein
MTMHYPSENTSHQKLPQANIGELLDQLGIIKEDKVSYTHTPKIEHSEDITSLSRPLPGFAETTAEDGRVVVKKLRTIEPDTYRNVRFVPRTRQLNEPTSKLGYKRRVEHYKKQRKLES